MPAPAATVYKGLQNLEVMEAARNYNAFLTSLVLAHAPPTGVITDFGAGTGTFAKRLADAGRVVSCVEPDPTLRDRLKRQGRDARASALDFAPESLDYVYSLNVLEHIEDDIGTLRLLRSRLKVGGRILIYVPAFQCLFSSMDRAVGHHRRYRRRDLIDRVRKADLEPLESRYCDSIGFFAALAFKGIDRKDGTIGEGSLVLYDRFVFPLSRVLDRGSAGLFGKNLLVVAERAN